MNPRMTGSMGFRGGERGMNGEFLEGGVVYQWALSSHMDTHGMGYYDVYIYIYIHLQESICIFVLFPCAINYQNGSQAE